MNRGYVIPAKRLKRDRPLHRDAVLGHLYSLSENVTMNYVDQRGLFGGYSPLMAACTAGQMGALKILLFAGASVNFTDDIRATPLHIACFFGHKQIAQVLIDSGASVNAKTTSYKEVLQGNTPLHYACAGLARANSVIKLLLKAGAKINAKNWHLRTPLHLVDNTEKKGNLDKIKILLEAGAKVNTTDLGGRSPAHYHASTALRYLLEFGADVDRVDSNGETPLHRSLLIPESVAALLSYGAGANVDCHKVGRFCGATVLMCCYNETRFSQQGNRSKKSVATFEKYFILNRVAGFDLGSENTPLEEPREDVVDWNATKREEFEQKCRAELDKMSNTIGTSTITYRAILNQRLSALRNPLVMKTLTFEHCESEFPLYGALLHSKLITAQRRLHLMDKCLCFFRFATPPLPLPDVFDKILAYLEEDDLTGLYIACRTTVQ